MEIPDKHLRTAKLSQLADELGMLPKNKPSTEEFNEQQLVLAIYDGFVRIEERARRNKRFLIFAGVGAILLVIILATVPRAAIRYFRYIKAKYDVNEKAYKGYGDNGELVEDEDGQPVLFHDMEGYYNEYYDDGNLHFVFLYFGGQVVEQKEYDRKGNLIVHFVYDEDGNPILD